MDSELYLDYNTPYHRLDARTKILVFAAIFIGAPSFPACVFRGSADVPIAPAFFFCVLQSFFLPLFNGLADIIQPHTG